MPYQDASISKQFTATARLLQEDQGKLTLDDAIARYVPGITQGDQITIRQLLSHTSGLQDYWPQDYSFAAMEHPITPQQIVDRWADRKSVVSGKSVSVRVVIGGRRIIKKKNKTQTTTDPLPTTISPKTN